MLCTKAIGVTFPYTPIRFRAQTLSSAITGGFKYAKLHLIYSHTMIQAVHRQLYLFTLHKMLNSLLLCSRMAPSNGDLYVLQTESVYTYSNLDNKETCIYVIRLLSDQYFNLVGALLYNDPLIELNRFLRIV